MSRRPRRRLLHTSDVHLGAYYDSAEQRAQREAAFRGVIDIGLRERVDVMLIAGDFFDNSRVHLDAIEFASREIARLGCPVIVSPGNHDHAGIDSVYDRLEALTLTPNLSIIRQRAGETIALTDLGIDVWGRAHTDTDGTTFVPFEDAPPRGDADWQIGIGHGHFLHEGSTWRPSFQIREADLEALDRDYVALGHWDGMTRVPSGAQGGVAAYCGSPDLLGEITGCGYALVIDLCEDGSVRLVAHPTDGGLPVAHEDIPLLSHG